MIKDLTKNKRMTEGDFLDAMDEIRDPGQHWIVDRDLMLNSNPHASMLVNKFNEIDVKRLRNKKKQKQL